MDDNKVRLSEGSGGIEMQNLIKDLTKNFYRGNWKNVSNDSASIKNESSGDIIFTSDSYVVSPLFFEGGNIGKIAFCGTVNDLMVMGADTLGISLSLIIEEGFSKEKLREICSTIADLSQENKIPIVTGDTKVMENGAIDGIVINTSGVGITKEVLDSIINEGDVVIVSGGVGEHATALLGARHDIEVDVKSCCKPLVKELCEVRGLIKSAKDITRGGLAGVLNEIGGMLIFEEKIPLMKEVKNFCALLGLDYYSLACEGRFVCVCAKENKDKVLEILKKYNSLAECVGEVQGKEVIIQTKFGKKLLSPPSGNIVPRIC